MTSFVYKRLIRYFDPMIDFLRFVFKKICIHGLVFYLGMKGFIKIADDQKLVVNLKN